jgi:hypothetical protein
MKKYSFKEHERAMTGGYTDLFVCTHEDLTVSTNDLLQNIGLTTLNKGDVVFDRTMAEIIAEFTPDPSADATVTVSVGRTAAGYTDMLAASNLINAGTQIGVGVTYAAAAGVGHQIIAADSTVVNAQFDIADVDGNLAALTAGEVWIWMSILRRADRQVRA